METLLSMSGIIGAICCVGMYAAVSMGRISAGGFKKVSLVTEVEEGG